MGQINYAAQIAKIQEQLVFCCNFATMEELKTRLAKAQARLADDAQLASTVEGYETSFPAGGTRPGLSERRSYIAARREIARRARGGGK